MTNVGEKLKSMRLLNNLTQELVANYLGIDQTYVAKMEKNEREINLEFLQRLADLYGCDIRCFSENINLKPIKIAYRADNITKEDLEMIAKIQRIALNLREMDEMKEK